MGDVLVVDQRLAPAEAPARRPERRKFVSRPSLLAGLTVLLVGMPTASDPTGVEIASVTPADLGAVLLVAVVGLGVLTNRDFRPPRDPLLLGPVIVVVAALVTTFWSTDPMLSLVGAARSAELFCLVPLAVVLAVRDRVDVAIVLGSVVILGTVEGAIGVFQWVTGTGASYQGETNRAIGTFGVDSVLAMAYVVSVTQVILVAVAMRSRGRARTASATGALLLVVPLLMSLSRGALLALAVAVAAMVLATGIVRALRLAVVGAAILTLGLAMLIEFQPGASQRMDAVTERIGSLGEVVSDPDSSVQDRYDLWAAAVSIWQIQPVTGVGIKQFPEFRDSHAPISMSSGSELGTTDSYVRGELLSPHNQYLLLLSEQGVLGLGAYLALIVSLLVRHLSLFAQKEDRSRHAILPLASFGLLVWYGFTLLYGDISGSTGVLYGVLLGMQIRAVTRKQAPADLRAAAT